MKQHEESSVTSEILSLPHERKDTRLLFGIFLTLVIVFGGLAFAVSQLDTGETDGPLAEIRHSEEF